MEANITQHECHVLAPPPPTFPLFVKSVYSAPALKHQILLCLSLFKTIDYKTSLRINYIFSSVIILVYFFF